MKYKKDNKLPNTKNVRRKTNPAGVTTIIQPKSSAAGGGGGGSTNSSNNQTAAAQGGGGNSSDGGDHHHHHHGGGGPTPPLGVGVGGGYPSGANNLPQLPPGSLKQEPGQYGLTSL
jgi:hypothetical protein